MIEKKIIHRSFLTRKHTLLFVIYLATIIFCVALYCIFISYTKNVDFERINDLYVAKNYAKAKEEYTKYVAKNRKTQTKELWQAWQRLLYITVQLDGDIDSGIQILQEMQIEYKKDIGKQYEIYKELLRLYNVQKQTKELLRILTIFLNGNIFQISDAEKEAYHKQYLLLVSKDRKYFPQGILLYKHIMEIDKGKMRDIASYGLATLYVLSEKYSKAVPLFKDIIKKYPLSEEINYMSQYMLGTIATVNGDKAKALEYFETIEPYYPNKKALNVFINELKS